MTLLDKAISMMMKNDRTHHRIIEERIRKVGLHRTAHMMLMYLSRAIECPSQREIAEHFSITPAAVTGILKTLERDGYIVRRSGKDCRTNEIAITDEGRAVVTRSREVFQEVDCAMFEGLTDEELLAYIATHEKIAENMERLKEENG